MLLGRLRASWLRNMLEGRGIIRVDEGTDGAGQNF